MSDSPPPVPLLSIDFELIENYRLATPAPQSSLTAILINPQGMSEIFYVDPDSNVYHLQPDSTSETGWSQSVLPIVSTSNPPVSAGSILSISAALDSNNNRWVCVAINPIANSLAGAYCLGETAPGVWGTTWMCTDQVPFAQVVLKQYAGTIYFAGSALWAGGGGAEAYMGRLAPDGTVCMGPSDAQSTGGAYCGMSDTTNVDISFQESTVALNLIVNPRLFYTQVTNLTKLYSDSSSTSPHVQPLSFWRPTPPGPLWAMVGDAAAGFDQPASCLCVASVEDPLGQSLPLLTTPTVSTQIDSQIWDDRNMGALPQSCSMWDLICPPGSPPPYTAIGQVVNSMVNSTSSSNANHVPPTITDGKITPNPPSAPLSTPIAILQTKLINTLVPGDLIFSTQQGPHGSDAINIFSEPSDISSSLVATGCFYAQPNFGPLPPDKGSVLPLADTLQPAVIANWSFGLNIPSLSSAKALAVAAPFNALNWCIASSASNIGQTEYLMVSTVGTDSLLYYLDQTQTPPAWIALDVAVDLNGDAINFQPWSDTNQTVLAAVLDSTNVLHCLAIGDDGNLYHGFKDPTGWSTLLPVPQAQAVTSICPAINSNNELQVAALIGDQDQVWLLVRDPDTGEWDNNAVEIAPAAAIPAVVEDLRAYTTEISVTDVNGVAQYFAAAQIGASLNTTLIINGESFDVGPQTTASCTTNASGKLVIVQDPQILTVPALQVWIDGMESGYVIIEPNTATLAALAAKQPNDLLNEPVIPDTYNTLTNCQALAQIFSTIGSMANNPAAPPPPNPYLSPNSPQQNGITWSPAASGAATPQMAAAATTGCNMTISFCPPNPDNPLGFIEYSPQTPDSAAAAAAQLRASFPPLPFVQITPGTSHHGFWGDIFGWLAAEVRQISNIVINGLEVTIKLAVQGINYVISTVLDATRELANQALDLISTILMTIQDDAAAAITTLKNWLSFLFGWDDILQTQQAMAYMINTMFAGIVSEITAIGTWFDKEFSTLQSFVDTNFATLITNMTGKTVGQPAASSNSVRDNWLSSHISNGLSSTQAPSLSPITPPDNFATDLQSHTTAIQTTLNTCSGYTAMASAMKADPVAFLQTAGETILGWIRQIFDAIITGAKDLLDFLLNEISTAVKALQSLLNQGWNIPLVTPLFARITQTQANPSGEALTTINLISLIMAIPATLAYKLAAGVAPFSDSPAAGTLSISQADFQGAISSSALTQGIKSMINGSSPIAPPRIAMSDDEDPSTASLILDALLPFQAAGLAAFRTVLNGQMDTLTALSGGFGEAPPGLSQALSWVDVACSAAECLIGCPLWALFSTIAPGFATAGFVTSCVAWFIDFILLCVNALLVWVFPLISAGLTMRMQSAWGVLIVAIAGTIASFVGLVGSSLSFASDPSGEDSLGLVEGFLNLISTVLPLGLNDSFSALTDYISPGVTVESDRFIYPGIAAVCFAEGVWAIADGISELESN